MHLLAGTVALLALFAIVGAIAATRPDSWTIERSVRIESAPALIFPLIDDLRAWRRWSPFEMLDPEMTREYSGAARGVGAAYAWNGNRHAGEGRMEIVESRVPTHIRVHVDFQRPFVAHNVNTFELNQENEATRVTWTMRGTQPFLLKVMSVFVKPDRLMGTHFETGLSNLRREATTKQV